MYALCICPYLAVTKDLRYTIHLSLGVTSVIEVAARPWIVYESYMAREHDRSIHGYMPHVDTPCYQWGLCPTFGVNCYFLGPTIFAIIVYFSISCLVCVSKAELHVNLELATQCTVNQVKMSSSRTHQNAHPTHFKLLPQGVWPLESRIPKFYCSHWQQTMA